jgi:hypothetical protein
MKTFTIHINEQLLNQVKQAAKSLNLTLNEFVNKALQEKLKELKKMTDRFDLEQQIMSCWNLTEELGLLNTGVLEGRPGGRALTTDEISNYLLGLEIIYSLKFEQLFDTFSVLVKEKQI